MRSHRLERKVRPPLSVYLQAERSHGIVMVDELAGSEAMLVSRECAIETSLRWAIDRAFRSKEVRSWLSFLTRAELTCLLDVIRVLLAEPCNRHISAGNLFTTNKPSGLIFVKRRYRSSSDRSDRRSR